MAKSITQVAASRLAHSLSTKANTLPLQWWKLMFVIEEHHGAERRQRGVNCV